MEKKGPICRFPEIFENIFWVWIDWLIMVGRGEWRVEEGGQGVSLHTCRGSGGSKTSLQTTLWSLNSFCYSTHHKVTNASTTHDVSLSPSSISLSLCWEGGDGGVVRTGRPLSESGLAKTDVISSGCVTLFSLCNSVFFCFSFFIDFSRHQASFKSTGFLSMCL